MTQVFFKPWVGGNYFGKGFRGKRIMILGESHYCGKQSSGVCDCHTVRDSGCREFTTEVMHRFLNRADNNAEHEGWMNTFTKFGNALTGSKLDDNGQKELWNSLLFYNYLQVALESPRQAGEGVDYEQSVEALFEVLEQYRPEYIIFWGYRLWDYLPGGDCWQWDDDVIVDDTIIKNGWYLLADGTKIRTFPIYHPSAAFDLEYWHKGMNTILNR